MEINRYNSQYTIINGYDSSIIINTTNSILDFGYYNITNYRNGMYILIMVLNVYEIKYMEIRIFFLQLVAVSISLNYLRN